MKIVQIYTPVMPLPPKTHGGVEQIITELVKGLAEIADEPITLFAPKGTEFNHKNIEIIEVPQGFDKDEEVFGIFLKLCYTEGYYDYVVHDHSASKLIAQHKCSVKHVVTCHGDTDRKYSIIGSHIVFNSLSDMLFHADRAPKESKLYNIASSYGDAALQYFNNKPDDYLLYLGRIEHRKGVTDAITIAERTDHRLIIAGNIQDAIYFNDGIKPHLRAGKIEYIGEVESNSPEKYKLIANAKAFLFPSYYHESSAGVVKEAAMCGTPIIAFPTGANIEDIEQGKTGYLCNTVEQMINAVGYIDRIDRYYCRNFGRENFGIINMTYCYYNLYKEVLGE